MMIIIIIIIIIIIEHVPKQTFNCSLKVLKIIRKVGLHGESLSNTY